MTTSKSQAEKEIKRLIKKYERVKAAREIKRYDEANTRKDFVMPLFRALGWDVYNDFTDREVVEEETAIKGKVDYSFRINNIPQFLLEAKALKEDLDKVKWAKQAVSYGWNKGIPWVVLTDFESLKLFNSEWQVETPHPNLEFTYNEFLKCLDDLWFLSRESIEKSELDKQAEKWGIKAKRLKVTEKLAADLLKWRELLYKVFKPYNRDKSEEEINESVQRVLDRFIFIRVCEDRQLEEKILWQTLQTWITHDRKPHNFMQALRPVFKEFDKNYNSNLFREHLCDRLDTEGTPFEQIINDLYADKEEGVKYNFSAISANVLGTIYEQYLGYIQEEGIVNGAKRKKHGIYYTPEFIVDYIVQNTLDVVLKEKPLREIEDIRVLDPACGSGSFLIKAFDLLDEKLAKEKTQEKSGPQAAFRKFNILRNNIYGVDLDSQAIEIARLNLLLKALEPNHKLPLLSGNTKVGNSLISGTEKELKKYFGENWEEKKPFNWQKEFPNVLKDRGFDIVIGNPPWGADIDEDSKYFEDKYPDSTKKHKDIYKIFIDRAISLTMPGGYLGFVIPSTFLYQPRYQDVKKIIDQYDHFVVNLGEKIFRGVQLPSCILILKKTAGANRFIIDLTQEKRELLPVCLLSIHQKKEEKTIELKDAIKKDTGLTLQDVFLLKDAGINYQAVNVGKSKKGRSKLGKSLFYKGNKKRRADVEYWRGSNIDRFYIQEKTNQFVRTDYESFKKKNERVILNKDFFELRPKLLWRQTASSIIATVDTRGAWFGRSIQGAVLKERYRNRVDIYYTLAILNSKYFDFLYRQRVFETGRLFPQVKLKYLRDFPFIIRDKKTQQKISEKVKKIIELNKKLLSISENTDRWCKLKTEVEKLDKRTDREVYKLYNLTPEEIGIIERKNEID